MSHHPGALASVDADAACDRAAREAPLISVLKLDPDDVTPEVAQAQWDFVRTTIAGGRLNVPDAAFRSPRTVEAETRLGETPSVYFNVGRVYPEIAGAVVYFAADQVTIGDDWRLTPFDSGGVIHGRIQVDAAAYGGVEAYVHAHSVVPADNWRVYLGRYVQHCFKDVADYWVGPDPTQMPCMVGFPADESRFFWSVPEMRVGGGVDLTRAAIAVSRDNYQTLQRDAKRDSRLLARLARVAIEDDPAEWAERRARAAMC